MTEDNVQELRSEEPDEQPEALQAPSNPLANLDLDAIIKRLKPDPKYKPVYKIRDMKGRDVGKLLGLYRQVQGDERIKEAIKELNQGLMQMVFIEVLLEKVEEEVMGYLGDLAQVDIDEAPFSAPFDILNDLMNNAGFLGALSSAANLAKGFQKLFGQ